MFSFFLHFHIITKFKHECAGGMYHNPKKEGIKLLLIQGERKTDKQHH